MVCRYLLHHGVAINSICQGLLVARLWKISNRICGWAYFLCCKCSMACSSYFSYLFMLSVTLLNNPGHYHTGSGLYFRNSTQEYSGRIYISWFGNQNNHILGSKNQLHLFTMCLYIANILQLMMCCGFSMFYFVGTVVSWRTLAMIGNFIGLFYSVIKPREFRRSNF